MKIKPPFEALIDEKAPASQRAQLLRRAEGVLTVNRRPQSASLPSWLLRPAFGFGLAGAAAALLVLQIGKETGPPAGGLRYSPEMVQNAEMLDDLEVLLKLQGLENLGKKKWQKRKS